jgi:catechol 2,3-dioxygenase-like lactoylglutathione lyase family enzyme
MKNRTITITLPADRDAVFAYLAPIENLPAWAPRLCAELRQDGQHWRGATPGGEMFFAVEADSKTGVIDFLYGTQLDEMSLLPMRVLRQPHGTVINCTFLQPAGWADELYELYYETLLLALRGLKQRFGAGEVHAPTTGGEPFYPSLVTANFYETWDFYTSMLGFRTVCESDFYVQLAHPGGAQLGVLRHELDGPSPELVGATNGRGFWLNLDVADADAEHARLLRAGVEIALPLEDKPWGDRQFVVRDPNGVLIAIAHRSEIRGLESRPLAAN